MATSVRIYPYKIGSQSASRLAEALRSSRVPCFKVFPDRKYTPKLNQLIVNWGSTQIPAWESKIPLQNQWLNPPDRVRRASNKLIALHLMSAAGVSVPEYTTDPNIAMGWKFEGPILERTVLNGHSGIGIVFVPQQTKHFDTDYDAVLQSMKADRVPLYVKYIKKMSEYRVHVFDGTIIDVQQKRKRRDYEGETNNQIRNYDNGWVYTRDNIDVPAPVLTNAVTAVNSLGLDFGAADVIWNQKKGQAYVLEVNTAPGLEGRTITSYCTAIINTMSEL